MHHLRINQYKFTGPSKWAELTAKSLINLATYLHFVPERLGHLQTYYLVYSLFNIPASIKLRRSLIAQIVPCIAWAFEKNELQDWLIKRVSLKGKKLYGPANRLANLTAEEFMYTEAAYERYLAALKNEAPVDDHLYNLAAILYRPKHWLTGKRKAFKQESVIKAAAIFKSMSPNLRYAIALNYAGCRNLIMDKYQHIWKKAAMQEVEQEPVQAPATIMTNWALVFLNLAGDKFGTYTQTLQTNIWILLADLDQKVKQSDELDAKLNK